MKKFKTFFYPLYIIVVILVLLVSLNIFESLELFKKWGFFKYFSDLPYMARDLLVFLSLLMVVELISENVHLLSLRGRVSKLEEEVLKLKAKLYDQSNGENPEDEDAEEDAEEEEDDEN